MTRIKRYVPVIFLIIGIVTSVSYAAAGSSSRYYYAEEEPYYDYLGQSIFLPQYYRVYDMTVGVGTVGDETSDIYKHKDKFWDRWAGSITIEDVFLDDYTFTFQVGESIPLVLTPLTMAKAGFDGMTMSFNMRNISLNNGISLAKDIVANVAFTRLSDPVTSELGEWEQLDMKENDYLTAASFTFGLSPVNLYIMQEWEEGASRYAEKITIFELKKFGLTVVNQYHNRATGALDLRGNGYDDADNAVYVKVSAVTNKGYARSAYVYHATNSDYIAVQEDLSNYGATAAHAVSLEQNTGTNGTVNGTNALILTGTQFAILKISIPPNVTNSYDYVRKLTLRMRLGGGFVVQAHTANTFESIDYARPLPSDVFLFNRNAENTTTASLYAFEYGYVTSLVNFSLSFQATVLNYINLYGEYAMAIMHRQYPSEGNRTNYAIANADALILGLDADVPIVDELLSLHGFATYYAIDQAYTTIYNNPNVGKYTTIDDNDNDNLDEGILADFVASASRGETYEIPNGYDNNDNAIPDSLEQVVYIDSSHSFFHSDNDRNNNFFPDEIEDDSHIDYPYQPGYRGVEYAFGSDVYLGNLSLALAFRGIDERNAFSNAMTTIGGTLFADIALNEDLSMALHFELKKVADTIENDYSEYTAVYSDRLYFKNSLVNTFSFNLKGAFKDFTFDSKLKIIRNNMLDLDNAITYAGAYGKLKWQKRLLPRLRWKNAVKVVHLSALTEESLLDFTTKSEFDATLLSTLGVDIGKIFTFDVFGVLRTHNDILDATSKYNRYTVGAQLYGTTRNKAPILATVGIQYSVLRYETEDAADDRVNTESFEFNVRVLSRY